MKHFPPSTTMWSPSGRNDVFMPVRRSPQPGSVMASEANPPEAMRGRSRAFCSSLPYVINGFIAWKLVAQMIPVDAQALLIS